MRTSDFDYVLPQDRIAINPLSDRSASRLLLFRSGNISDHRFSEIKDFLPDSSLLIFNDSRVIPARLFANTPSGAAVELFLLEPASGSIGEALASRSPSAWKSMIGNKKRWKEGQELTGPSGFTVRWMDRQADLIELRWKGDDVLATLLEILGKIPLPPYLKRDATPEDNSRYQTVYARVSGAVAAPTAGLHFTNEVLDGIRKRGFKTGFLTLHVGAGTFLPVKADNPLQHHMHEEELVIGRSNIRELLQHDGPVIPVGTTSMRSLETIYWTGVKVLAGHSRPDIIGQEFPYTHHESLPEAKIALSALDRWMERQGKEQMGSRTSIFIRPGYRFRICDGLITNFHQPRSTLLMLIAALIGNDWKKVYEHALGNGYRFLSYGDSSLLLPERG